jgi:hypothetical protein
MVGSGNLNLPIFYTRTYFMSWNDKDLYSYTLIYDMTRALQFTTGFILSDPIFIDLYEMNF